MHDNIQNIYLIFYFYRYCIGKIIIESRPYITILDIKKAYLYICTNITLWIAYWFFLWF